MLFQVHFLSLLLEERGAGDLAAVAEHCRQKLIRRHPHVFGDDVEARSARAGEVLRNWDQIKAGEEGREPGIFGDVPENLPALLYARKVQRRAASAARPLAGPRGDEQPDERILPCRRRRAARASVEPWARKQRVDPELGRCAPRPTVPGERVGER